MFLKLRYTITVKIPFLCVFVSKLFFIFIVVGVLSTPQICFDNGNCYFNVLFVPLSFVTSLTAQFPMEISFDCVFATKQINLWGKEVANLLHFAERKQKNTFNVAVRARSESGKEQSWDKEYNKGKRALASHSKPSEQGKVVKLKDRWRNDYSANNADCSAIVIGFPSISFWFTLRWFHDFSLERVIFISLCVLLFAVCFAIFPPNFGSIIVCDSKENKRCLLGKPTFLL